MFIYIYIDVILGKFQKLDRLPDYFDNLLNQEVPLQLDNKQLDTTNHFDKITLFPDNPSQININTAIKMQEKVKSPGAHQSPADTCKTAGKILTKRFYNLLKIIWKEEVEPQN